MSPGSRIGRLAERLSASLPRTDDDPALRWAAVAVIIAPDPDAILLIQRAEHSGDPWSGHMALPGGRQSVTDTTLLETAMRESAEEVGIQLDREQLIGRLDDVAPRTPVLPPIAVRPYVFLVPRRLPLILNPEVAAARWVGVDDLLQPDVYGSASIEIRRAWQEMPAYRLDGGVVWGMTERILTNLLLHLR